MDDEAPMRLYHARGVRRFGGRHFGGGGAAAAAATAEREKRAAIREQGLRDDISSELAEVGVGAHRIERVFCRFLKYSRSPTFLFYFCIFLKGGGCTAYV